MRVCFIGACGHSRQAYKYLKTRADVEFVGMAAEDAREGLAASFSPEIPFFGDWREMLDAARPNLAVISPIFGHTGRVIRACAARGIDVFAEKPVAADLDELEAVAAAVRESGIRFSAMHYLRYDPAFYHAARLVREGEIGEVRMITAQKSYRFGRRPEWYGDRECYVGTIPWVGIHAMDWIYHFTGRRFLSVTGQCFGRDPEMAAICQFQMEGGVLAAMNLDYFRPEGAPSHGDDRVRCVGTEGIIEVCGGEIRLMNRRGNSVFVPKEAPELLEEFLCGGGISAEEVFYLTRVALAARDAAVVGEGFVQVSL